MIKPLPERVRHSVRSGVIMFDMTKVVEELVFNSLDSGAEKISIFVGVVTCYVKVVDDGSGVCRDDLALLGQRYATSKFHNFADLETTSESFGFRGEALASISDISVLEITTKAVGKPNGYRKAVKGCKCLYIGIDDERKDCGTTVIVRDLFYNQPVRRKYMQSSPKKVLDSIKKCVLRIAVVHSNVSFSVLDIESDEEILQVNPSSSALSLLMRGSGTEALSSLHRVYGSDGMMNISGYISGLRDSFTMKAFQFVYINFRFVSKGPIHKLLNNLAASLECTDSWKSRDRLQSGKHNRPQSNPAYILCVACPRHLYDFSFEPSKTYVEFKNWEPVLAFIEKVILDFWKKDMSIDWPETVEPKRKRFKRNSHVTSSNFLLPLDVKGNSDSVSPHFEFAKKSENLKEQKTGTGHQTDTHLKSWNIVMGKSKDIPQGLDATDELEASLTGVMKSSKHLVEGLPLNKSPNIDYVFRKDSKEFSFEFENFNSGLDLSNCIRKRLRGCSSRSNLTLHEPALANDEGTESFMPMILQDEGSEWLTPVMEAKQDGLCRNVYTDTFEFHRRIASSDSSLGILKHENDLYTPQGFQHSQSSGIREDSRILPKDAEEFCSYEDTLASKKYVSVAHLRNSSVGHCCMGSDWSLESFDTPETMWDSDDRKCREILKGNLRSKRTLDSGTLFNEEDNIDFDDDIMPQMYCRETGTSRYTNSFVGVENYSNPDEKFTDSFWRCAHSPGIEQHGIRKNKCSHLGGTHNNFCKQRSRRSHSAPPFYRQKKRFVSLSCSDTKSKNSDPSCSYHESSHKEVDDLKYPMRSLGDSHRHRQHGFLNDASYHDRKDKENNRSSASDLNAAIGCRTVHSEPTKDDRVRDFVSEENLDPEEPMMKWRHKSPMTKVSNEYHDFQDMDNVLDISSGLLHRLADESLVPDFVNRDSLEHATVLQQIDKKYIPVVASGMLVIIDQHAADERIRLEELRVKVLTGEARTVTYLDTEQELILPEMGYQLLQSYADQIRDWGWIYNISGQGSISFKKDMNIIQRQRNPIMLHAVPCVLGVNLSDDDLLEFLQQLADTDGSSTIPPSVRRVLNSKACRGAIMFGDSLLPSECSLIIEGLKQTSLCFQCAHGRPTTAPLVNLNALHKHIAKLGPNQPWHGLQRQVITLDRAKTRLTV